MSGRRNRRRGFEFEREIVNRAKESGLDAQRAYASNGQALGEHCEVDAKIAGKRIQAKRRKKLADYLLPNENVDAVIVRQDRGQAIVLITLEEYFDLLAEGKRAIDKS